MTLEAILSSLSHNEKLAAMDLLWRDLSGDSSNYLSPTWHEQVIAARLAKPASGKSLRLSEAKAEVRERLDARRAQG